MQTFKMLLSAGAACLFCLHFAVAGGSDADGRGAVTVVDAGFCPPLAPAAGPTVTVDSEAALRDQAYNAAAGTTILVSPGVYDLDNIVHVVNAGITIRGATGNRADVILDAGGMLSGFTHAILIEADDVTVADLTIRNAGEHGVSVNGSDRPTLYNLHIVDTGYQLVKVNPVGDGSEDGLLACSHLEYTTTAPENYTNGISAHDAHRWAVRDNRWERIRTPDNMPAPTILFWSGSSDTRRRAQPARRLLSGHRLWQRQPRPRRSHRRRRAQQHDLRLPAARLGGRDGARHRLARRPQHGAAARPRRRDLGHGGALCRHAGNLCQQPDQHADLGRPRRRRRHPPGERDQRDAGVVRRRRHGRPSPGLHGNRGHRPGHSRGGRDRRHRRRSARAMAPADAGADELFSLPPLDHSQFLPAILDFP